ncbi:MAG: hypothetical protein N4A72_22145 [Bacteroidales bacterium]|jgi:hypothetical protein|nr:hypothetical protein [Bacteroidales bacterium]
MAKQKVEIHRGIQEQEDWESTFIKQIEEAKKAHRIQVRDKREDILRAHNMLPEQYGYNSPHIQGVESSRAAKKSEPVKRRNTKKTTVKEIAAMQKEVSNLVEIDDIDSVDSILDRASEKIKTSDIDIYSLM